MDIKKVISKLIKVKFLQGIGGTALHAYHDIDNHVKERNRGIAINAVHIEYVAKKMHYLCVGCQGHPQHVNNKLTGAELFNSKLKNVSKYNLKCFH